MPHGTHDNGQIAGALQNPGSVIVTLAIRALPRNRGHRNR